MQVKCLNISFAKLGLEECETCLIYDAHSGRNLSNKLKNNGVDYLAGKLVNEVECKLNECEVCSDFKKHIDKVLSKDSVKVTTDMQKVIMLITSPGVKEV